MEFNVGDRIQLTDRYRNVGNHPYPYWIKEHLYDVGTINAITGMNLVNIKWDSDDSILSYGKWRLEYYICNIQEVDDLFDKLIGDL